MDHLKVFFVVLLQKQKQALYLKPQLFANPFVTFGSFDNLAKVLCFYPSFYILISLNPL